MNAKGKNSIKESKTKMTASTLMRLAGLSAMLAGLCMVVMGLFHPVNVPEAVATATWVNVHIAATAMSFFGLFGMAGLSMFGRVPADRAVAITDGMTLDVGEYELQFFETPNIHWPETMMTYETKRKILFACDAFGSYGKVPEDAIFDDQLSEEKHAFFENEALRYYANIVAAFSGAVLKGLTKLSGLDVKIICPSHGIIWRENPGVIIDHYKRYAEYSKGPAEREITLVWSSMYGSTKSMLNLVVETIRKHKIPVHVYQAPGDDIGYILAAAWKSAGLIFGMPTYEYKVFPPMSHVIDELLVKKVTNKKVFRFGSYGWVGGAQRDFESKIEKSGWDLLGFYEWQGAPTSEDEQALAQKIDAFCEELIKFTE